MFFKILPISNTGVSAAYILATVQFLYPKLGSFSDMEYYFYQLAYQDSKVPKCFVGLIHALPLLTATGANKTTPLHVGTSYTHDFGFYSKRNVSATHPIAWAGSPNHAPLRGWRGGCALFQPPLTWGHPFKIPPCLIFRAKGGQKTINFFGHFHGLILITNIWSTALRVNYNLDYVWNFIIIIVCVYTFPHTYM